MPNMRSLAPPFPSKMLKKLDSNSSSSDENTATLSEELFIFFVRFNLSQIAIDSLLQSQPEARR